MKKIHVLIADDHQMFIDGIKSLLAREPEIKVIGEALNGEDVINILQDEPVDIVLLDINMPVLDGIEATKIIRNQFPDVKVLILTMYNKKDFITNLIEVGANGYILKNTGKEDLLNAIHTIAAGGSFYGRDVTETIMESLREPKRSGGDDSAVRLTKRETDVLKLITEELTTQEIAAKLFISQHTVETHRKNLLSKLNVRNTAGLVKFAIRQGLVE